MAFKLKQKKPPATKREFPTLKNMKLDSFFVDHFAFLDPDSDSSPKHCLKVKTKPINFYAFIMLRKETFRYFFRLSSFHDMEKE